MCKLPPFPKDLILHHHGEGEILPKLLQEHHEGLAFSLGKFLVYFCLLLFFFLNSLLIPSYFSTLFIYLCLFS